MDGVAASRFVLHRRSVIVALAAMVTLLPSAVVAQDAKAILMLHTYGANAPGRFPFDAAFARALREAADIKVDLYVETLDPNRFDGPAQAQQMREYLRERYAGKQLAVVAAAYDRAATFLTDPRDPPFPGMPVAALLTRRVDAMAAHVAATGSGSAFGRIAAVALKLQPRARHIALIDGASGPGSEAVYGEALAQIEAVAPRVPVIPLRNLPLDALLPRVTALPPDTIIVLVRQVIGHRGEAIATADAVTELVRVAPAPLYVPSDQLVGSGAVGGVVVSLDREARNLASLALTMARDGTARPAPIEGIPVPMFDARALQRWGLDEAVLPAGSGVRFRQTETWARYRLYILGAALLLLLQTALIARLVLERVRRRSSDQALRESEQRFRLMADGAPVMVWTARPDMATDFFNSTVLAFTGLSMEELIGDGWLMRMHPDDVERCVGIYVPAFRSRQPFQMEYRFRRADEAYRWVLDTGVPRYGADGSFAGYIGSALDITERRELEQSLLDNETALRRAVEQNQDLAGRLINAQEEERTRIARGLHDDVSQQIAGIGILLSGLKRKVKPDPHTELETVLAGLQDRTAALADAIRHLSHELHPGVLKHAGLVAALEQHCAEVERHHGVTVRFKAGDNLDGLDFDSALCLYRVAQEALTNVVRHARARTAGVELQRIEAGVELRITDEGVGFVASERSASGLGLRSIDERVRLARGSVSVLSQPGRGTAVQARIPLLLAKAARAR